MQRGIHSRIHGRIHPDRPACIMAASREVVTHGEVEARSCQVAQLLREAGLRRGDTVAILMENNVRFLEVVWGAHRAGLYYTPIGTTLTAREVSHVIRDCGAQVLITSHALKEVARELPERCPDLRRRLMIGGVIEGFESYELSIARHSSARIEDESHGVDLLYSSGTTGLPKGVKRPLSELAFDGEMSVGGRVIQGIYGIGPDSTFLSPAPLYHAAPLRFVLGAFEQGATCVLMERFDAEHALRLIEELQVTESLWVPTMLIRMLKLPPEVRSQYDLSSHRRAMHGAAPCPTEVKRALIDWWGPILYEYYAGTEVNGLTTIDSHEWQRRPGSVGQPIFGKIHILDDDGNELPAGQTGVIYFEGGARFEYLGDPEQTRSSRTESGWTTLGDIGHVDADGYLYLSDRKAHMIISGGVNLYPRETEDVLVTHPKVVDVAVFGVPNDDLGEEMKAVVQPLSMADAGPELERELIAFCRESLSRLKCPRSIDFESELPRTEAGKLLKRELKTRYWPTSG